MGRFFSAPLSSPASLPSLPPSVSPSGPPWPGRPGPPDFRSPGSSTNQRRRPSPSALRAGFSSSTTAPVPWTCRWWSAGAGSGRSWRAGERPPAAAGISMPPWRCFSQKRPARTPEEWTLPFTGCCWPKPRRSRLPSPAASTMSGPLPPGWVHLRWRSRGTSLKIWSGPPWSGLCPWRKTSGNSTGLPGSFSSAEEAAFPFSEPFSPGGWPGLNASACAPTRRWS
ncbi:hypothetical protein SDC9_119763 [bioreactor metagenome]|uniref:Uncharacterized protein n=1 Tax=bioreactor metagenome TaxID=1076179 RepID=A0A645C6K1_9ZZZZ